MTTSAFLVLVKSKEQQFWVSNEGYKNSPRSFYQVDETVANSKHINLGSLLFVRLDANIIGVGQVHAAENIRTSKSYIICPKCRKKSLETRKDGFACVRCKEFFSSNDVIRAVTEVTATRFHYQNSWCESKSRLTARWAERYLATKDTQSSIRRVNELLVSAFFDDLTSGATPEPPRQWLFGAEEAF